MERLMSPAVTIRKNFYISRETFNIKNKADFFFEVIYRHYYAMKIKHLEGLI
jgi:hypothetical protein